MRRSSVDPATASSSSRRPSIDTSRGTANRAAATAWPSGPTSGTAISIVRRPGVTTSASPEARSIRAGTWSSSAICADPIARAIRT